jgi:hypothetical protein
MEIYAKEYRTPDNLPGFRRAYELTRKRQLEQNAETQTKLNRIVSRWDTGTEFGDLVRKAKR